MTDIQERRLPVGWGDLAVTVSGNPQGQRLLCVHGWMDNAASFAPLAQRIPEACWVSLDIAGHGASDHRPPPAHYYLTDYFLDIDAVLDQLGWDSCTLVGHSMGTGIVTCYACADPQRVERLVMLDGLGVATEEAHHAGGRLVSSLQSLRAPRNHRRVFESPTLAARARQLKNPMNDEAALSLALRALRQDDEGWRWRTDPRAMWNSPLWMTEAQSTEILHGIQCPVLAIITPFLAAYLGDRLERRLDALKDVTALRLDGGHHLHMDDPDAISGALRAFLNSEDATP